MCRWCWGVAIFVLGSAGGLLGAVPPEATEVVRVGSFSEMDPAEGISNGWQSVSMAAGWDTTAYKLVRTDHKGVVVRARSQGGASSLGVRRRVDLTEHPILEWSWKVDGIVEDGRAGVKEKHDFPARVYVSFAYEGLSLYRRLQLVTLRALGFDAIPTRSISYVWANHMPADSLGSVFRDPFVNWLRQMAVRSGTTHVGTWRTERRNVRADYHRIFGEEPPPVKGVAIFTDTDQTGETVTAYYGDIVFRSAAVDAADQFGRSTSQR